MYYLQVKILLPPATVMKVPHSILSSSDVYGDSVVHMVLMQGNGYGLGAVMAAKAFLEGGFKEVGVGDLNEALALRRAGIKAPVQVCYQPDVQSARAIATAPDLQVRRQPLATSVHLVVHPWHVPGSTMRLAQCDGLRQVVQTLITSIAEWGC